MGLVTLHGMNSCLYIWKRNTRIQMIERDRHRQGRKQTGYTEAHCFNMVFTGVQSQDNQANNIS